MEEILFNFDACDFLPKVVIVCVEIYGCMRWSWNNVGCENFNSSKGDCNSSIDMYSLLLKKKKSNPRDLSTKRG